MSQKISNPINPYYFEDIVREKLPKNFVSIGKINNLNLNTEIVSNCLNTCKINFNDNDFNLNNNKCLQKCIYKSNVAAQYLEKEFANVFENSPCNIPY